CLARSSATIASTVLWKACLSPFALDFTRFTRRSLRAIAAPPFVAAAAPAIAQLRIRYIDAYPLQGSQHERPQILAALRAHQGDLAPDSFWHHHLDRHFSRFSRNAAPPALASRHARSKTFSCHCQSIRCHDSHHYHELSIS